MSSVHEYMQTMLSASMSAKDDIVSIFVGHDISHLPSPPSLLPPCLCCFLPSQPLLSIRKNKHPHVRYFEGKKFILLFLPTHEFPMMYTCHYRRVVGLLS